MSAELSKRIRYTKPGQTIVVPMGMEFPHAVRVDSINVDSDGQIIGVGQFVAREGCSTWAVGCPVAVCLGWK